MAASHRARAAPRRHDRRLRLNQSGAAAPVTTGKAVNAPLPGVIVAVSVKPGETVAHGQELCTIEAMKMKNVIRAGRAGTIAAVHVTLNQHVKHHDVLLEFTD